MENEILTIFDEHRNPVGVATREEVHRMGHWHETFQCWFMRREEETDYIYFQIRSATKKDYPNLLDITAAGHLLAHETVGDGIREVEEELGIAVSMDELVSFGVIKDSILIDDFIDNEFANVFLFQSQHAFDEYNVQQEEVSGIVRAEFNSFSELWFGESEEIRVEGFEINKVGKKGLMSRMVSKNEFVPHGNSYYQRMIQLIEKYVQTKST